MKKLFTLFLFAAIIPAMLFAQKTAIRGVVTDANSGETLIGATILYSEGKGVVTDMDGRYYLSVEPGTYHLKVSYVGYLPQEVDITVTKGEISQNFALRTPTLTEVEVIGDIAKSRETPVAFSTVKPIQIQEELAARDIPMLLNKTPGVYATKSGGGDGDARINIRGFNQRNLAVMIDGIPVNDMENGWVYWSNWFGLDAVTRNIQVQRGLGASKLALPSVGGTMNIITKGIDANFGAIIKQEVGSDYYFRTSVGVTTGQLKNGWGFTFAASYKQGDGWVDNTWTKGWFGYMRVDKKLGNHTLTFSAMGAPQQHAQRSYMKSISSFDKEYAASLGVDTSKASPNYVRSYGIKYNSNWGYLNRWTYGVNGERIYQDNPESLPQSLNYYFKPQLSLRDFWRINDKLYLSTIVYASIGNGGGTSFFTGDKFGTPGGSTPSLDTLNGLVTFQKYYDGNMTDDITPGRSSDIIRNSVNNHYWYGLLSTFTWELNSEWTISGGLDLRTYRGQHYGEIRDMLGGQYFLNNSNQNRYLFEKLHEDDKIYYHNDAKVRWGGIFAQAEWKKEKWSVFLNITSSLSGYQRIDYFRNKDLLIDGAKFTEAIGYGDIFYYNGSENLTYTLDDPSKPWQSNDTVFVTKQGSSGIDTLFIVNPTAYNIDSKEAMYTRTGWKLFPGFTLKGGANYNLDTRNNIFMNLGYLTKAPRFSNVYYNNNREVANAKNENILALELGYSYNSKSIGLNVNGYLTKWNNKPLDATPSYTDPKTQDTYPYNVNGINAFHKGIEVEFGWKIIPSLQWDQVLSFGDWRWTSGGKAYVYKPDGSLIDSLEFNAKGVHVGDAAQFQFMESLRWEIIKYLYVSGSMTLFGKNYSNMDPGTLTPKYMDENGNPPDSWQMPLYYLVDVNAGYRFVFKTVKLDIRASVLNLLDKIYISDAQNNDSYSAKTSNFDAASAGVFFGTGRTFNASIALSF